MSDHSRDREETLAQLVLLVREHMAPPPPGLSLPVLPNRVDRLMSLFEAMGAWICEFDHTGHMSYCNPIAETILGYTAEECVESAAMQFHPDDIASVIALGKTVSATGKPSSS